MRRPWLRWLTLATVLFIIDSGVMIGLEGPRSSFTRALLATYLHTRGLRLTHADVRIDGRHLDISKLTIDELDGRPLLQAASLHITYAIAGTSFLLQNVILERPHIVVRRAKDGSFEIARVFGGNPSPTTGARARPETSLHLAVRIHDGWVDFINHFAPAPSGRAFALCHVNLIAHFDQGAMSHGNVEAIVFSRRGQSHIAGNFIEDDVAHRGQLHATARHAALAPIVNYFVSSPAFVVEDGAADVAVYGDATAWPQGARPIWSITARGMFYDTRLHVSPLIASVRSLNGPFLLNHGVLMLPRVTGLVAGLPLAAHGAISMQPSLWLDLKVGTQGPLHLARKLLAMLKPLALEGNVAIAARILGEPQSPHVGVAFAMPHGWLLAKMPVGATAGMLVYNHGHVTLPFAMARYAGFSVQFNGDGNVGASAPPPI